MSLVTGYSSEDSEDSAIEVSGKKGGILDRLSNHIVENPDVILDTDNQLNEETKVGGFVEKVYVDKGFGPKRKGPVSNNKKKKQKRNKGSLDDVYLGPWASFSEDENQQQQGKETQEDESQREINISDTEKEIYPEKEVDPAKETDDDIEQPSSEYLAKFPYPDGDFLSVPSSKMELLKVPGTQQCYAPKKVVHKFQGHENGVSKLEFFPNSGHLLLSGGNDSIIRLWDLYNKRELIREYYGHNQSIKDLMFDNTGEKFISCSFDSTTRVWDTKSGKIIATIKTNSVPTALLFNPKNNEEFLIGLMSGKIEHYHLNDLSKPMQVYDHHLSTINIIHAIENGNKFLSASDDKSVRIWNWGINIPAKIITHPTQYAIASVVSIPPNDKYVAMQNMNNTIQVIDGYGRYKFKKKQFRNPNITGHKIEIHISPDGRVLASGDSRGNGLFWDWHSGKMIRQFKISDKMINNIKYHPQEPSKVVAGGSDGKIYYCD